jgi:NAD/NADP transhydrogenase beta subunit
MDGGPWTERIMDIGTLIAVFLTLCIFSFLYKDNPFYRLAEHLLVGISVGYVLVISVNTTLMPKLINPVFKQGEFIYIIPGILGIFMLLRFAPRFTWLSRISIALIIGAGAGVAIPATIQARLFSQMQASMSDLASIDGIIIFLGIATTLAYFFFSKEHKGWFGATAKVGTWFLMIFFGATFGYTVMSRISLLIGRMQFLLGDFLHIIK